MKNRYIGATTEIFVLSLRNGISASGAVVFLGVTMIQIKKTMYEGKG